MDQLIKDNLGLVINIVDTFKPRNETEREDLIAAGTIGLWKGLKRYDKNAGHKLSTFVWKPIRWEIIKELKRSRQNQSINQEVEPYETVKEPFWELYSSAITNEEKETIELRRQGYSIREIANKTNQNTSTVRYKFIQTLNKIRKIHAE